METSVEENAGKKRPERTLVKSEESKHIKCNEKKIEHKLSTKLVTNMPIKISVSPTTILAQNIALLPSGVAKVKQPSQLNTPVTIMKPPTSGSATGKHILFSPRYMLCIFKF